MGDGTTFLSTESAVKAINVRHNFRSDMIHFFSWVASLGSGGILIAIYEMIGPDRHLASGVIASLPHIARELAGVLASVAIPGAALMMYLAISWVLRAVNWTEKSWRTALVLEGVRFSLLFVPVLAVVAIGLFGPITWPVLLAASLLAPMLAVVIQWVRIHVFPSSMLSSKERKAIQRVDSKSQSRTLIAIQLLKVRTLLRRGAVGQLDTLLGTLDSSLYPFLLVEAAVGGHLGVVNQIMTDSVGVMDQELLLMACIRAMVNGHTEVVKAIFEAGCNAGRLSPRSTINGGSLLYHAAISRGLHKRSDDKKDGKPRLALLGWLVDQGCDVDQATNEPVFRNTRTDHTPLGEAVYNDDHEAMSLLVKKGAQVSELLVRVARPQSGDLYYGSHLRTHQHLCGLGDHPVEAAESTPAVKAVFAARDGRCSDRGTQQGASFVYWDRLPEVAFDDPRMKVKIVCLNGDGTETVLRPAGGDAASTPASSSLV